MSDNDMKVVGNIKSIEKTEIDYYIEYGTNEKGKVTILNSHVFRYYMSPNGEFEDYPYPQHATDEAKMNIKKTTDYDPTPFQESVLEENDTTYTINTTKIQIIFDKSNSTMSVKDKRTNNIVFKEIKPIAYRDGNVIQTSEEREDEYFYGGGMQNGRFSHKGEIIKIETSNVWTDGSVTSPCPFYWSSYGFGIMRNSWCEGTYDFAATQKNVVITSQLTYRYDAYIFINPQPKDILADYYELTGYPIFMPKFAFYEAHLNTFNRDYWVKVDANTAGAILFEDGKYYKSYKPEEIGNKTGILESLNGETKNYQFSARAMVDRYKRFDMPLGWFIPNDGYGSGYGQTDSLDGDIANLKSFTEYANKNGVEVALWTESNLEPVDPNNPKKGDRDLTKEVGVAGIRALKCDVAWIGDGDSFALNAVEHATHLFKKSNTLRLRPLIMMVDGWAGTQRYSGIWTGDQSGGEWEYIRFHIPTYICSGLSGVPVVGSDMDGIYGGNLKEVNIRDYQWKTFTPIQLNMDGWGSIPKTPFSFDVTATNINRAYLKLKSVLMPYNYTIGHESTKGLPMVRAMFLEFPYETPAYTTDSQYQFMWGPSILVAPIYNDSVTLNGHSIRNGLFLPDENQVWIDFLTGEKFQGGKLYNNIIAPIWKIPIYVKDGAIIPITSPNNNPKEIKHDNRQFLIYPNGSSRFTVYEDDGTTTDYLEGSCLKTNVSVMGPNSNEYGDLYINIEKSEGYFKGVVTEKITTFYVMASKDVDGMKAAINGFNIPITEAETEDDFENNVNVYYYKDDFAVNPYMVDIGDENVMQSCIMIKINQLDITQYEIQLKVKGYTNNSGVNGSNNEIDATLTPPTNLYIDNDRTTATSIALKWDLLDNVQYYEIERDGFVYSNITGNTFAFDGFKYNSQHTFRIRSVGENGVSEWSDQILVKTKKDPRANTVKGVKVTCNLPCQPNQEVWHLTDGNDSTMWHTNWGDSGKASEGQSIILNFDLGAVLHIEKAEYTPRRDAGNGTFLELQYKISTDGKNWSPLSSDIKWDRGCKPQTIMLDRAVFRYMEVQVHKSVRRFGSGIHFMFYKAT